MVGAGADRAGAQMNVKVGTTANIADLARHFGTTEKAFYLANPELFASGVFASNPTTLTVPGNAENLLSHLVDDFAPDDIVAVRAAQARLAALIARFHPRALGHASPVRIMGRPSSEATLTLLSETDPPLQLDGTMITVVVARDGAPLVIAQPTSATSQSASAGRIRVFDAFGLESAFPESPDRIAMLRVERAAAGHLTTVLWTDDQTVELGYDAAIGAAVRRSTLRTYPDEMVRERLLNFIDDDDGYVAAVTATHRNGTVVAVEIGVGDRGGSTSLDLQPADLARRAPDIDPADAMSAQLRGDDVVVDLSRAGLGRFGSEVNDIGHLLLRRLPETQAR
jgi:hypothetical protein